MGRTSDAHERLLTSARELIHERGYNAVGVGEICARADVHKGSFYHFFPSKQQLVLEVIEDQWRSAREGLESVLLGPDPPLSRLRRYLESVHGQHSCECDEGSARGCPLGNLALELSTQDVQVRERLRQAFDAHIGYLEHVLREARQQGQLEADLDPRRTAEAIIALLEGAVMLAKVRADAAPLAHLPAQVSALIGTPLAA